VTAGQAACRGWPPWLHGPGCCASSSPRIVCVPCALLYAACTLVLTADRGHPPPAWALLKCVA
jgi:hypothetical protein